MKRWFRFLLPAAVALAASSPALADIYVHLKDGKIIILPVDRDQLDYIEIIQSHGQGTDAGKEDRRKQGERLQIQEETSQDTDTSALAPSNPSGGAEGAARAVVRLPDAPKASLPDGGAFRGPKPRKPQIFVVGPDQKFKRPSDLEKIAGDGDTIEIEAGTYNNDYAEWEQSNLTLKGIGKGHAHLASTGEIPNGKAIWIMKGDNVTVENIEFSGAKVDDRNGAGIRFEGGKLTIRHSYFHDNEFGILSDNRGRADITIENSEFFHQTREDTYAHNIYIGVSKKFRLTGSYIHGADGGHQVKSRAYENYIAYNRIEDGKDGNGSYAIDLSNCGESYVIGNVIQQGRNSENYTGIAYGAEGCDNGEPQDAYIVNNTFVNEAIAGTFVTNHVMTPMLLRNNLIVGITRLSEGPVKDDDNLLEFRGSFVNRAKLDFHLAKGDGAIDKGIAPGKAPNGMSLMPEFQYKDPLLTEPRHIVGKIDIGAYEYQP